MLNTQFLLNGTRFILYVKIFFLSHGNPRVIDPDHFLRSFWSAFFLHENVGLATSFIFSGLTVFVNVLNLCPIIHEYKGV